MQSLAFERWSAGDSRLHKLDPRVKLLAVFVVLLLLAWTDRDSASAFGGYFLLLTSFLWAAGIPLVGSLLRTFIVLPFVAGVVILNLWGGDPSRAALLMIPSAFFQATPSSSVSGGSSVGTPTGKAAV